MKSAALALIESVKNDTVLFVGETIQDEYHYVSPMGKSPKEHLIPVRYKAEEVFQGGVVAAAAHARTICGKVMVATSFPSVRKVRFVDDVYFRKVFEVHYDETPHEMQVPDVQADCVVVTDFGHGRIGPALVERLCKMPFVAVAAQTNSSNIGYNLITKYPRADYIVIDEPEARLAAADRVGHIEDVMHKLAHGRCERFVVTLGGRGAVGYDHGRFFHQAALSENPLDTMGAGDAFFAVTAPMARTGNMEELLYIGCAAGALKTQIIGHRKPVTKEALIEFIRAR